MSYFNDRIEINTSRSVIIKISKTSFGFCNNLDLSVSVFTQPNLSLRYLDNHLLPGISFYSNQHTCPMVDKSGDIPQFGKSLKTRKMHNYGIANTTTCWPIV